MPLPDVLREDLNVRLQALVDVLREPVEHTQPRWGQPPTATELASADPSRLEARVRPAVEELIRWAEEAYVEEIAEVIVVGEFEDDAETQARAKFADGHAGPIKERIRAAIGVTRPALADYHAALATGDADTCRVAADSLAALEDLTWSDLDGFFVDWWTDRVVQEITSLEEVEEPEEDDIEAHGCAIVLIAFLMASVASSLVTAHWIVVAIFFRTDFVVEHVAVPSLPDAEVVGVVTDPGTPVPVYAYPVEGSQQLQTVGPQVMLPHLQPAEAAPTGWLQVATPAGVGWVRSGSVGKHAVPDGQELSFARSAGDTTIWAWPTAEGEWLGYMLTDRLYPMIPADGQPDGWWQVTLPDERRGWVEASKVAVHRIPSGQEGPLMTRSREESRVFHVGRPTFVEQLLSFRPWCITSGMFLLLLGLWGFDWSDTFVLPATFRLILNLAMAHVIIQGTTWAILYFFATAAT